MTLHQSIPVTKQFQELDSPSRISSVTTIDSVPPLLSSSPVLLMLFNCCSTEQIAYADRIIVNKKINRMAQLKRTEFGKVNLDYVLGIGGFDLERCKQKEESTSGEQPIANLLSKISAPYSQLLTDIQLRQRNTHQVNSSWNTTGKHFHLIFRTKRVCFTTRIFVLQSNTLPSKILECDQCASRIINTYCFSRECYIDWGATPLIEAILMASQVLASSTSLVSVQSLNAWRPQDKS
nr:uncharacterized protein LOC103424276 isoform X2 [Malus domestica]